MPHASRHAFRRPPLVAAVVLLVASGGLMAAAGGGGPVDPAGVVAGAAPSPPAGTAPSAAPEAARPTAFRTQEEAVSDVEAYRTHLAYAADGWWWTDNAAYSEADGGMEAYGIRMNLTPGGLASTGCLWGLRDGGTVGPFWYFSSGWDPEAGRGFAYQSGPGGAAGFGYQTLSSERESVVEQVFHGPDGTRTVVRHEGRHAPPDTMHDRSLNLVDGEWVASRTYTWVRRHDGTPPC